jgi:large subunit ribosomal protein L29
MAKAKDLRDQSIDELEAAYNDTRKELFQLVNELKRTKKMEKPHLLRQKRKDIARLLTVITEKQAAKHST